MSLVLLLKEKLRTVDALVLYEYFPKQTYFWRGGHEDVFSFWPATREGLCTVPGDPFFSDDF